MAHHTSPSFVNSSIYNHSTPAFHFDRTSSFAHASSSSSPLTDDLVTPRDGEKMEGLIRGRMTTGRKDTTRRSVRVREASGHSSPYLTHEIPPNLDYIHSTAHLLPAPALPQLRNPSNTRKRVPPPPQRALTNPSDIFARAQAYGITVDQFENAKQQVRDFLRADPSSANDDKGKGKSLGRSASYAQIEQQMSRPTSPPSDHFSYLPAGAGIASTPAHNGTSEQYYERPISVPSKTVKTRPSLEQIVERSADRRMSGKGRNLMQWSESRENDFSGDEQGAEMVEVDQSRPYGDAPMYNNLPTPHSVRVSHLAHNESPTFSASGSPAMQHPASRQLPSAHRGMLERFMYDREKVEDFQGAPVEPAASQYQHPTHHQQYSPSILLPRNPAPSHSSIFAPPPMPVSPTSSRPSPKDQLCSPDVARLLRSELNELAVQSRRRSVEDDREDGAEDDIVRFALLLSCRARTNPCSVAGGGQVEPVHVATRVWRYRLQPRIFDGEARPEHVQQRARVSQAIAMERLFDRRQSSRRFAVPLQRLDAPPSSLLLRLFPRRLGSIDRRASSSLPTLAPDDPLRLRSRLFLPPSSIVVLSRFVAISLRLHPGIEAQQLAIAQQRQLSTLGRRQDVRNRSAKTSSRETIRQFSWIRRRRWLREAALVVRRSHRASCLLHRDFPNLPRRHLLLHHDFVPVLQEGGLGMAELDPTQPLAKRLLRQDGERGAQSRKGLSVGDRCRV